MTIKRNIPSVSVSFSHNGKSSTPNALGMRECKSVHTKDEANSTY